MSQLRSSAIRTARTALRNDARLLVPTLTRAHFVRFESTHPPSQAAAATAAKNAKERDNKLTRDWDARVITYNEIKPKTQSPTPNTWLIDVREPDEVMQGMIPSAVNIPLTVLPESLGASPKLFAEKFGFEKPGKNQEVTFYCRSGMRSTSASDIAKRNGYTNILNYKGSWLEWVEKEGKK